MRHQIKTRPRQISPLTSHVSGLRLGVIGAGTMGQALIKGLLARGLSRHALVAADADAATRRAIRRRYRIDVTDDNRLAVRRSHLVILAVKPQQCPEVVAGVAPHVHPRHLVISIAAGISLRWLQARLPGVPIVRVMPNLPATVGRGFSAITLGRHAQPRHRALAQALCAAVGDVVELPERAFDAITAVSGSGPAYVFFLADVWEAAARALGLPASIAARAVRQTLAGSVALLERSGEPAAALIRQVASKGGTTEAALTVLARRRVGPYIEEALRAASRRSRRLSWS